MAPNLFQWDGFDKLFSPRDHQNRTRSASPSSTSLPSPALYAQGPPSSSLSSEDDDYYSCLPLTPPDSHVSLDDVWENVRRAKERSMSNSPSKVKSLERHTPMFTPPLPPKSDALSPSKFIRMKKGKSYVKYKESQDGYTVTAVFDLPKVEKEDMHVSFQGSRIVVSWRTVKVTEREESLDDGTGATRILRELEHKKYSRTIPLPDGTRFEQISAARDGRHLVLTYPNIRRPNPIDAL